MNVTWGSSYRAIKIEIIAVNETNGTAHQLDSLYGAAGGAIYENAFLQNSDGTYRIAITTSQDRSFYSAWVTLFYTKND